MKITPGWHEGRDLILFIQSAPEEARVSIRNFFAKQGKEIRLGVIVHNKSKYDRVELSKDYDVVIALNIHSPKSIISALKPYNDEILVVTCRGEVQLHAFRELIPYFPYLRTPNSESLDWATDKSKMRRRFSAYDSSITPKAVIAKDATAETVAEISKKVGFPLVVKPSGLAQSLLVTICYHEDELQNALRKNFRLVRSHYKERGLEDQPRVVAEQFMEGQMYSVDSYVNSRGKVYHCPAVYVETGRSIGFDDFFGYYQMTPTLLNKDSVKKMEEVTEKGIHALSLRNTTCHTELLKTERGWKIIEIGARVGGFRHKFYEMSFGINHSANDVLIRIPEKPIIPKKVKGWSGILKFYARKEGRLKTLKGLKNIRKLESVKEVTVNKKVGDMCRFAKHGGKSVVNILLFNPSRDKFLADKRRIEKTLEILA